MAEHELYVKLDETARAHVTSCNPTTPGSNDADPEAMRTYLHPDARTGFGHSFFVSTAPNLKGEKNREGFISHVCGMGSALKTWKLHPQECCIDVDKRTVVLRVRSEMVPKAAEEIINDIVYWFVMDGSGEQVVKMTEFLDAAATKELRSRMQVAAA
jgi:hypothetical protein